MNSVLLCSDPITPFHCSTKLRLLNQNKLTNNSENARNPPVGNAWHFYNPLTGEEFVIGPGGVIAVFQHSYWCRAITTELALLMYGFSNGNGLIRSELSHTVELCD